MKKIAAFISAFLFPAWIGGAQTVIGGMGMLNSMFGPHQGPSPGQRAGQYYQPQFQGGMDQNFWNMIQQLQQQNQSLQGQVDPTLLSAFQQMGAMDYSGLINAADRSGAASTNYGDLLQQLSQQQRGQIPQMQAAQDAIFKSSMDPRGELRSREEQHLIDQSNAINSMYGLGTSGVGGATTKQAVSDFGLNWENQQLARQLQGIQGMNTTNTAIGRDIGASAQLYGGSPTAYMAGGATPLSAREHAAQAPMSAAQQYMGAMQQGLNPMYQLLNPQLQYMNYGVGANAGAFDASMRNAGFQSGQQYGSMNSLFQGLQNPNSFQQMQSFFGGGSPTVPGSDVSGWGTGSSSAFGGSDAYGWGGPSAWGTDAGGMFSGGGAWGGAASGMGDFFSMDTLAGLGGAIDWAALGDVALVAGEGALLAA